MNAIRRIHQLDGITSLLPSADFVLMLYQREDAVASGQVEGIAATMADAI
jgi:hypothetical protein